MFNRTPSEFSYEVYTYTARMNLLVGDIHKRLLISSTIIFYYILYSYFFVISNLEPTCKYVLIKQYIGIFNLLC